MPIFVKPEWHQTLTHVTIKIPSHGVTKADVDVLTHEIYIKAHYQQYIFEVFLFKSINVTNSTCTITDTDIIFELSKTSEEEWIQLEADLSKPDKKDLRNQIIKQIQEKTQKEQEEKSAKKAETKRSYVRLQMAEDSKRQAKIKDLKKQAEENALKEMELWEEKQTEELIIKDIKPIEKPKFKKSKDRTKYKSCDKIQPDEIIKVEDEAPEPAIPVPRKCQTFTVSFTQREFPTPQRESKLEEEQEWLAKQAAARRSVGFDSDDLRPEERNPQWLLAKGDEFYKAENYLGAISAYTEGIKISKNFVDLYVKRSSVHYKIGNYERTLDDCSKALEIMTSAVAANLDKRLECIVRRGNALRKIGFARHAISELEEALKLSPGNEAIKKDLREAYMDYSAKKREKEEKIAASNRNNSNNPIPTNSNIVSTT